MIRDIGRVLDMPYAEVDRVANGWAYWDDPREGARREPSPPGPYKGDDPKLSELLGIAKRFEGMARHASVHAAVS